MMSSIGRLPLRSPTLSVKTLVNFQSVRHARHKPWHPRFKLMRHIQPFLQPSDLSKIRDRYAAGGIPMKMYERMKQDGFMMPSQFMDRMVAINHTGQVFDQYIPPEGDGKASLLSTARAGQEMTRIAEKTKSYRAERQIRRYDDDFDSSVFATQALDMYKNAHKLLEGLRDREKELELLDIVTERAYAEMTDGLEMKTFRWHYHESIEPPRAVHVRVGNILSEDNRFGQVTVRIFSKQSMAIYDRFGRPVYGSEEHVKDVLEYVVFEKHLADEYGTWKLHGKVVPEWMPPKNVYLRTMRIPSVQEEEEEAYEDDEEDRVNVIDEDVDENSKEERKH